MQDIKIKNPRQFTESLLKEYLASGLGRMQKRDIDVLILHLLIQDEQYTFPRDMFKAARELKLTEARLRNLYQDSQLRYRQLDERQAKATLVEIVQKGAFEVKSDRLIFIVRDPMLGLFFEEWVADVDGFTDSSFNSKLVSVSHTVFLKVLENIATEQIPEFPRDTDLVKFNNPSDRKGILQLFVEEFAKSAGSEAGKMSVKALASALKIILGLTI